MGLTQPCTAPANSAAPAGASSSAFLRLSALPGGLSRGAPLRLPRGAHYTWGRSAGPRTQGNGGGSYDALSLAELESYSGGRLGGSGREVRALCPFCGDHHARDNSHASLARLRYNATARMWTLFWRDRNQHFHRCRLCQP